MNDQINPFVIETEGEWHKFIGGLLKRAIEKLPPADQDQVREAVARREGSFETFPNPDGTRLHRLTIPGMIPIEFSTIDPIPPEAIPDTPGYL